MSRNQQQDTVNVKDVKALYAKVNPTDGKITFRLELPEGHTGEFTKLSASKVSRIVNVVNTTKDSKGVTKYRYILNNLLLGYRSTQGVRVNAEIHTPLLEVVKTKKQAAEFLANLKPAKSSRKNSRKGGRRSRKNSSAVTAAATGGANSATVEAIVKRVMEEMAAQS